MDNTQTQTDTSAVDIHPICQNSPTPEKCEKFAEKLEQVNSNLDINGPFAFRIQAEARALAK